MRKCRRFFFSIAVISFFTGNIMAQNETGNVITCTEFHVTKPLTELFSNQQIDENFDFKTIKESTDRDNRPAQIFKYSVADGSEYREDMAVRQTSMGSRQVTSLLQNWLGQNGGGSYPPDPTGAVGTNNYVQAVNATPFKVWSKTGTLQLTGSIGTLFGSSTNDGDPIVLYDKYADRWFLSQFGSSGNKVYIAISKTSDPTGQYYTYTFTSPAFPDYQKFSVWQDAYYMCSNGQTRAFAFQRDKMLTGDATAKCVYASYTQTLTSGFFCPLPADADGQLPSIGTSCPFFAYTDNAWGTGEVDAVKIWNMTVNWVPATPTLTIASPITVPTSAFDASYNSSWNDIIQPTPSKYLDGIGGVPTFRAQWRKWSGYNTVVLNWGVKLSLTQRSIRWCELRQDQNTGTWSLYQEGTYAPDAHSRWCGSIAMDDNGSIALCYSKSSSTISPSLGYTGRLATDPLGTMSFAETMVITGSGSQTSNNRFGDYSHTSLDPDGITFWHTGEYLISGAPATRVYSFQLPAQASAPVANFNATPTTANCTGLIQFTDASSGAPISWLWDFGDGQTSTVQNPSNTYATSGTYTVTLTVTNLIGNDQEVKTDYITVNVPTVPITTGGSICGTGTVSLSAIGSGILHWFDASTGGTDLGTGTTYTTSSISTTTTYYVENHIQQASQYVGPLAGGSNNTTSYYISFDCTTPVVLASVSVTASTAGNRTIELRNSSNTTLLSTTVNIPTGTSRATLNFNIPVGTGFRLYIGANANLTRLSSGVAYPYTLTGLISITGSSAGTNRFPFFFDWEIKPPDCVSARVPVVATVNTPTEPVVFIDASITSICPGTSVTFNATPTNGGTPTYQWQINGSNAATGASFTSTSLNNGDIVTCVMTSTSTCVTTSTATSNPVTMTVNTSVTPTVTIAATSSTICSGTLVTFTPTPAFGGVPTYQWLVNGNNETTGASFASTGLNNGDIVTCIMTSSLTCATTPTANSNAISMAVATTVTPTISISASNTTICPGDYVTFTASVTNEGITPSYQWQLNGVDVGTDNASVTTNTISNNDVITCILTSSENCTTANDITSNAIAITVSSSTPISSFTYTQNQLDFNFSNTSTGATSYLWDFGDGTISVLQDPTHTYSIPGMYIVTLISYNPCDTDQIVQSVNAVDNSVLNASVPFTVSIYPNPSRGITTIDIKGSESKDLEITIHDAVGKNVFNYKLENRFGNSKVNVDLSGYEKGIYYFTVRLEKETQQFKVIRK